MIDASIYNLLKLNSLEILWRLRLLDGRWQAGSDSLPSVFIPSPRQLPEDPGKGSFGSKRKRKLNCTCTTRKLLAFQQTTLAQKRKCSNRKWTIYKTVHRYTHIVVTKITVGLPHLACWKQQAVSGLLSNISNMNIWHKCHKPTPDHKLPCSQF